MIVNGFERDYIVHDDKNIKGLFGEHRYMSNFERCDVYLDGDLYGSSESARQFYAKGTDSKSRLKRIMNNIVENNGNFKYKNISI